MELRFLLGKKEEGVWQAQRVAYEPASARRIEQEEVLFPLRSEEQMEEWEVKGHGQKHRVWCLFFLLLFGLGSGAILGPSWPRSLPLLRVVRAVKWAEETLEKREEREKEKKTGTKSGSMRKWGVEEETLLKSKGSFEEQEWVGSKREWLRFDS